MEAGQGKKTPHPHVVVFPLPYQGHINPMLQLATFLHSKGFAITVFHTRFHSPNPSNFPHFVFEPIPDGLPDDVLSKEDPIDIVDILNETCREPFHDRFSQIATHGPKGPVTCIITDVLFHFTQAIADGFNLPRFALCTSGAIYDVASRRLKRLKENGSASMAAAGGQLDEPVPEISLLRLKDLPDMGSANPDRVAALIENTENSIRSTRALIWNTFEGLESTELEEIKPDFHPVPIFVVGPLHMLSPGSSNSLLKEDYSCMAWLDKQSPGSVLYVSFGSVGIVDTKYLEEIAWGLANSGQPFLWVVRPGLIQGQAEFQMPDGFEEETRERGCVVEWAPQEKVLAHPSVGAFWTHNGWNSTLEGISRGVPMICSPYLWDQKVNARYVSQAWGMGLQLEKRFDRGEIEHAIKRLMVGAEGKEVRKRINDFKEIAIRDISKGGSSYESAEDLSKLIMIILARKVQRVFYKIKIFEPKNRKTEQKIESIINPYVSHAGGLGLQLEKGFDRGEIEQVIRRLMVDAEGKEIRKRINDLKEIAISETNKEIAIREISRIILSFC
ncbi:hypothetical protein ACLOJK_012546 [Asimina triloba]